jgi:hypothetical protein
MEKLTVVSQFSGKVFRKNIHQSLYFCGTKDDLIIEGLDHKQKNELSLRF